MVAPDGRAKLLDFGLAKTGRGNESDPAALTQAPPVTVDGVIMGTAAYMSPEQARGQALDTRTDVWSFGCLLYELLSGRQAFPADTMSDTIVAVLEREPNWEAVASTTPAAVSALLQRCLHKDRSRRLHHIADARLDSRPRRGDGGDVNCQHGEIALVAHVGAPGPLSRLWRCWRRPDSPPRYPFAPASRYSGAAGTATLAVLPFHVTADSRLTPIWGSGSPTTSSPTWQTSGSSGSGPHKRCLVTRDGHPTFRRPAVP